MIDLCRDWFPSPEPSGYSRCCLPSWLVAWSSPSCIHPRSSCRTRSCRMLLSTRNCRTSACSSRGDVRFASNSDRMASTARLPTDSTASSCMRTARSCYCLALALSKYIPLEYAWRRLAEASTLKILRHAELSLNWANEADFCDKAKASFCATLYARRLSSSAISASASAVAASCCIRYSVSNRCCC